MRTTNKQNLVRTALAMGTVLLTLAAVFLLQIDAFGQEATSRFEEIFPTGTAEVVLSNVDALYGALIVLGGYLSKWIPGINLIDKGVYRVLAFAILVGVIFWKFSGKDALDLGVTYAITTSLYEVIFKLIGSSPKPDPVKTAV